MVIFKLNIKIIIFVFIAFLISFSALYLFQLWSKSYVEIFKLENNFFMSNFDTDKKKILLLGSSEIGVLNATYINENLKKHNMDYVVYNLAIPSDTPTQRLQSIDKIISMNPKLVIYCIGYRDFADKSTIIKSEIEKSNDLFPTSNQIFDSYMLENNVNSFLNLQSPKFVSIQVLNTFFNSFNPESKYEKTQWITNNTPFLTNFKETQFIKNSTELELEYKKHPPNLGFLNFPDENNEVMALENTIEKLKDHDVKVVILITPHAKIFHKNLSDHNKNAFNLALQKLSEHNVVIYSVDNKYENLDIWYDYYHVSIAKDALVFTNDVLSIIESEINS